MTTKPLTLAALLLATTAATPALSLTGPQTVTGSPPPAAGTVTPGGGGQVASPAPDPDGLAPTQSGTGDPAIDIGLAGEVEPEEIVVVGRNIPEPIRATPEVVNVLTAADIARTGEGNIAGALQRVTGLSVVGNGFVFVRGLGERYSLALLNGSPLPSPEPLRRVIPLDIFPTNVLASSTVQKSYSANYPGEFGGGVIDLETVSIPAESYLTVGVGGSGDTETTGQLGYTYFGSRGDAFGFDSGARRIPGPLASAFDSGRRLTEGAAFTARDVQDIAASLTNAPTTLLQRNGNIPANFSADFGAGHSFDLAGDRFGVIASAGFSNSWRTRQARQQVSNGPDSIGRDFSTVLTGNRVLLNGLLGFGAEVGEHSFRWTNVYIRDVLKQGRLAAGFDTSVGGADPVDDPDFRNVPIIQQNTFWFERQLINTQAEADLQFGALGVDLRGSYANSKRNSPYERGFSYVFNPTANDFTNNLSSTGQSATIAFSELDEDVWNGAIDLSYEFGGPSELTLTAGYSYTDTARRSVRRDFQYFRPDGALNLAVSQLRPDFLVSDFNIYTYNIQLREVTPNGIDGAGAFDAALDVHAGYAQAEGKIFDRLRASAGVRFESARQSVTPVNLFPGDLAATFLSTRLENDYFLPTATVTWNFAENMQLRAHASQTIARPQFRELALQLYQDNEADRQFFGNPNLVDSRLFNAETRYEWYFARGQRLTAAGFYKKIENPIEAFGFLAGGGQLQTSFVNAPAADLYGGEFEAQAYVPLSGLSDGDFWLNRRLVLVGNYTYTKSQLNVSAGDTIVDPFGNRFAANLYLNDGDPLTGQSDHLVNLQLGLEDTERLSQQTILFTYASDRVTNRGPRQGIFQQPDITERPGIRLDFVAREGVSIGDGREIELKFEARNLTGTRYSEFQQDTNRRIRVNEYDVGTSFAIGAAVQF